MTESDREDALRLDWLDAQWTDGVHVEVCAVNDGRGADSLTRTATVFMTNADLFGPNIRSAIDEAMRIDRKRRLNPLDGKAGFWTKEAIERFTPTEKE